MTFLETLRILCIPFSLSTIALVAAPIKNDILRFYVVHKNFDNLLQSKYLGPLYDYTNKMMKVTMDFRGEHYDLEDFCQKEKGQTVG